MTQASTQQQLSRRQAIVTGTTFTGGLALGFFMPSPAKAAAPVLSAQYWGEDAAGAREVNAWVVVDTDGTVILRCPMAEMGQGTGSGLPMLLAEELECDWKQVKVEFASVNRNIREKGVYRDMLTVGSRGIRSTYEYVQQGGASARERLVTAAAAKWGVPRAECDVSHAVVRHGATNRQLAYADLVADAAKVSLPQEPQIKLPSQFKLAGTRQPRLDSAIKSDGSAKFGIDTHQPGQLYASIMSCPVPGGKLVSVDESAIAGRRGIKHVVKLADAVAVVADNYWRANEALKRLKITWDGGEAGKTSSAQFARDLCETARRGHVDRGVASARHQVGDHRCRGRGFLKILERQRDAGFVRDREQVQHGIR